MKKSLIALAVAGAFIAPAAMADTVTVFGQANVSYDVVNSGQVSGAANVGSVTTNHVTSNNSRLDFKGTEDLGDGVSAIWQIDERLNFVSSGATASGTADSQANYSSSLVEVSSGDTFAGLKSETLGSVWAGIHDTPYKMATRGLDLFFDVVADNRGIMGNNYIPKQATTPAAAPGTAGTAAQFGDLRLNNIIAYVSPAFSGLTLSVATATDAATPVQNPASPTTKGSVWSFAAVYNAGPVNVDFAYQTLTVGANGTGSLTSANVPGALAANDKATLWKLGGSYTIDALKLIGIYEKQSASTTEAGFGNAGDILNRTAWYLGAKYSVGTSDAVKAAYTSAGNVAGVADSGAKQFSIGYDHGLSKTTTVYALYSKISNDTNAGYTFNQGTSIVGAPASPGADPSVFSLGMKHAF